MRNDVWKNLYLYVSKWLELQPWNDFWSGDQICVHLKKKDYYCMILGRGGDCIGVSIYEGDNGYADLCSIGIDYADETVMNYIFLEQRCLTFYVGKREDVPQSQLEIMQELGLSFSTCWPYFISLQPHFYPYEINDTQAGIMASVFRQLLIIVEQYRQNKIQVDFAKEEMIYAYYDHHWIYEARPRPAFIEKFFAIEFTDSNLVHTLANLPASSETLAVDLCYLYGGFYKEEYDRPITGLVLIIMDISQDQILYMNLLEPECNERQICLETFSLIMKDYGKPARVLLRNPMVYGALASLCEDCDILIEASALPMIDDAVDKLNQLDSKN